MFVEKFTMYKGERTDVQEFTEFVKKEYYHKPLLDLIHDLAFAVYELELATAGMAERLEQKSTKG